MRHAPPHVFCLFSSENREIVAALSDAYLHKVTAISSSDLCGKLTTQNDRLKFLREKR